MSLPPIVTALLRPELYPHRPPNVTLVQTHISYVLVAGDDVYKVKKPVHFSFLDFSTVERRHHFCREEVRLNRRLAADVYHGVVSICRSGDGYRLGLEDDPAAVEFAVHMRRLPEDRLLDHLLDASTVTPAMIDQVAHRLVEFHQLAECGTAVTENGAPAAVWGILEDNFTNVKPFRGIAVDPRDDDAIQAHARGFLDRHADFFRGRQAKRRIKDCHGDLHSEHICFMNGLAIFDCIEFNPRFRFCDVASDIAFLTMDLDFHDRADLSAHLVRQYAMYSGDAEVQRLVPFYACYRAYVRGKVDSLKSAEGDVSPVERATALESARRHFALAYRYTWAYARGLVVVAGLSGTGKSALAAALCRRTGFAHLNSDVIRKALADVDPANLYAPETSARTYATMLDQAAQSVDAGRGAIIDATFQRRAHRDTVRDLARRLGAPVTFIECDCGDDEVRRRLRERVDRGDSVSDADWSVYVEQRKQYEPYAADEAAGHLQLDTRATIDELLHHVEPFVRARLAIPPDNASL